MPGYETARGPRGFGPALAGYTGLLVMLAWACGGGGGNPCRTETSATPSPEASLTLNVGSYEGTGSPQCIRGLGFDPVLVIVKGDTDQVAVWRSSSMDFALDLAVAQDPEFVKDSIASLDLDAFSLGKHPAVNKKDVSYFYVAFADSPGINVGSYVADGEPGMIVSGIGFEPALVLVRRANAGGAVWRSIAHEEGVSSFFNDAVDTSDAIVGFERDGFRVGSHDYVNAFPSTYHYVAFRDAPSHLQMGTYVGDGRNNRDVTGIGFQPDYVWIKNAADSRPVHRTSSVAGDVSLRFAQLPNTIDGIQALLPDGFQVGSEANVNSDGDTFHYVAWKANSGP